MAKIKYTRINTPVGVAVYPRFNEPDTKFVAEGVYHTKLRIHGDEASDFIAQLEGFRDDFASEQDAKTQKTHSILDVFEEELNDEGDETGYVLFTAKLKAKVTPKTGDSWEQKPGLFDSMNNEIGPEIQVWGGSRVRLNCDVVPYAMASTKTIGVSLRLKNVQVIELVSGGAGSSPFGEFEGGAVITPAETQTEEPETGFEDGDDY